MAAKKGENPEGTMIRPRRRGLPERPFARWDINRLVADFGGFEPLIAAHRDLGFRPLTYSQVGQWRLRGNVPPDRLAEILLALRQTAKGTDPWSYIQVER